MRKIHRFRADEDFDPLFLASIVLVRPNPIAVDDETLCEVLERPQLSMNKFVFFIQDTIPEGPYFVRDRKLHRTWRLYPDIYEAFHLPTIHDPDSDKLTPLIT